MNSQTMLFQSQAISFIISEIFSFFSDTPGGTWVLAILCELLQEMINAENWRAAEMVVREMHQVAEVDLPDVPMDQSAIQAFYTLLTDCIIEMEAIR